MAGRIPDNRFENDLKKQKSARCTPVFKSILAKACTMMNEAQHTLMYIIAFILCFLLRASSSEVIWVEGSGVIGVGFNSMVVFSWSVVVAVVLYSSVSS